MIVIPSLKLCYQDLPKVASTTTFSWLYECTHGVPFPHERGHITPVHHSLTRVAKPVATEIDAVAFDASAHQDYFVFTLTRDPIRRFISMYSNRVIHFAELGKDSTFADRLKLLGLPFTPEINVLVDNLDAYHQTQPSIFHHSRPMIDFLGKNISIYTRIVDVKDFTSLSKEIRQHFEEIGMADIAKIAPPSERLQTGGPKLGLEVLTPYSFELLLDYYKEDYDLLPTVSLKATKDAYVAARNTSRAAIRERIPAAKELPGKRKVSSSTAVAMKPSVSCPPSPVAQTQLDAKALPKKLVGTVLLSPELNPKGWNLTATADGKDIKINWQLPSPVLQKKAAGNPNAATARLHFDFAEPLRNEVIIRLHSPSNETWVVGKVLMVKAEA